MLVVAAAKAAAGAAADPAASADAVCTLRKALPRPHLYIEL